MIETRESLLDGLERKWEKAAQRMDDYRGIQMCVKDLKEARKKGETPIPTEIQDLLGRTESTLQRIAGKPFIQVAEVADLIKELRIVVRSFTLQTVSK